LAGPANAAVLHSGRQSQAGIFVIFVFFVFFVFVVFPWLGGTDSVIAR
jgi:hypothetical protein